MVFNRRFGVGLAVSLAFLLLLFYRVDLGEVGEQLRGANYLYLVPAVVLYFVAVFFRTLRWRYLLDPMRSFAMSRLYPVVVVGYMANNLMPVRLGELVRAYHLGEKEKFSASTALASIVVERVYDGLTLLFLGVIAAFSLLLAGVTWNTGEAGTGPWLVLAVVATLAFIGAVAFLSLLASSPRLRRLVVELVHLIPSRLRPKTEEFLSHFIQGLEVLRSPRRHFVVFLLSFPVWLSEAGVYSLIALSFHLLDLFTSSGVFIAAVLLVTATSNLATAVPSTIGGIGPFEYVSQRTLVILGLGTSIATTYASFLHIIALWLPVTLVGLFFLWRENLSLAQIAHIQRPKEPAVAHLTVREMATGEGEGE